MIWTTSNELRGSQSELTTSMTNLEQHLRRIEQHLLQVTSRIPDDGKDSAISHLVDDLKDRAVQRDDQCFAKKFWCYEAVQTCQNSYIRAFADMKNHNFFAAWKSLERSERVLANLERHFELDVYGTDAYRLLHIGKSTSQFQRLYPYKLFFSAGFVVRESSCSICGRDLSLRDPCGHTVGEVYKGQMCVREIKKADLLEVSMVENPVYKYAVPFQSSRETGKSEDDYNYAHLDFAIERLEDPFTSWDLVAHKRQRLVSDFDYVGSNDPCPCGSGSKFKRCCIRKEYLLRNHLDIRLYNEPARQLSRVLDDAIVRGIPRYPLD